MFPKSFIVPAALICFSTPALAQQPLSGSFLSGVTSPFSLTIHGVVNIACTSGNDTVTVAHGSLGSITVSRGIYSRSYPASSVTGVRVRGGYGNDTIRNHTGVPSDFDGGPGNDDIVGGSGNDVLHGGSGADTIHGGNGRDEIYGGYGNDWIHGGYGQDRIVTVGGGVDLVYGGYQWDNIWCDVSDSILDLSSNENLKGYLHRIAAFDVLNWPGNTFQSGLDPNGVNLPDPRPLSGHSVLVMNQAHAPLFGPGGPVADDVNQGSVGDCYLMAKLSATAAEQPEEIRKMVTSLGDGTYAVRFYRNGLPRYIRVDADLWTFFGTGTLAYARPGASGAIWAPIIEKAFAFFRKEAGTYSSVSGGNTAWGPTAPMLGATATAWSLPTQPTEAEIIAWVQAGRPNNGIALNLQVQANQLMDWIDLQLQRSAPVYTGSIPGLLASSPIQAGNYRKSTHIYHIQSIQRSSWGVPTAIVLRDPYGAVRTVSDPARIVFLIASAACLDF